MIPPQLVHTKRQPTFGYLQDPEIVKNPKTGVEMDMLERDYSFTDHLLPKLSVAAQGDVDLSKYATDSNQHSLSSCAGNATADAIEIITSIKYGSSPQLSRLFVYTMARALMDSDRDGRADVNRDEGTYIRLCFDVLKRFGICTEALWPYREASVFTLPSILSLRSAAGHRIRAYYRIKETGQQRVDAVISALHANHPVVFGSLIDETFTRARGPSVVDVPTGTAVGGHAMIVVGYKDGNFKVKNSWGRHWRDRGYCYFTPNYLAWSNTWDLWVPTIDGAFKAFV